MQLSGLVAGEAERFEQFLRFVHKLLCYQRTDPDHLVAVVGVGDEVGIVPEGIEDGRSFGGKAPDTARRFLENREPLPSKRPWQCASAEVHILAKSSPTTKSGLSGP